MWVNLIQKVEAQDRTKPATFVENWVNIDTVKRAIALESGGIMLLFVDGTNLEVVDTTIKDWPDKVRGK